MTDKILLIAAFFFTCNLCNAQIDQNDPNNVPIDGGLSLALAAGAGYVVKRRHDAKKRKAMEDEKTLP
jgi:hypothetical protein